MVRAAAASPPSPEWHAPFLRMLPKIRLHAKVAFRGLDPEAREEAMQEVVANALKAYVRLWELGKTEVAYPLALARYAVAQTREGRQVGGHLRIRDIMSRYCQKKKRLHVERLDKFDKIDDAWQEIVVEDKHAGPADIVRVRLDFAAFLKSLPARLRRIAKFLAAGETTKAAAEKFHVSMGRISQIRGELKRAWLSFVGDEPEAVAA